MADAIKFEFDEATHSYTVNGVRIPSVTQILESVGLVDYKDIPRAVLNYAADRSIAVHTATEFFDQNDLDFDSLDEQVAKYFVGWRNFRKDYRFEIIESEKMHVGELHGLKFGMRVDRLVKLGNGQNAVIDIKCTSRVHPAYGIQTAGYVIGLGFGFPCNPLIARRFVVHLKPSGLYGLHEYKDPQDGEVFAAALRIAYWKNGGTTT